MQAFLALILSKLALKQQSSPLSNHASADTTSATLYWHAHANPVERLAVQSAVLSQIGEFKGWLATKRTLYYTSRIGYQANITIKANTSCFNRRIWDSNKSATLLGWCRKFKSTERICFTKCTI